MPVIVLCFYRLGMFVENREYGGNCGGYEKGVAGSPA